MYGLPQETDLSFLEGSSLIQVAVGENEVILRFHPQSSIMIAGSVRIAMTEGEESLLEDARQIGAALLSLLGLDVESASVIPPGTLRLIWRSGQSLDLLDSWNDFESYTVTSGNKVIVV